jgi:alpha-beta hydrolase superfamily lysophospholipase
VKRSTVLWLALGALILVVAGAAVGLNVYSAQLLATGPNGPETPASAGVPFERVSIPSHGRSLDGYLVRAPGDCKDPPAVLIYHGFNETISYWVQAQALLWRHCVSSLVFDPSGDGDSTRPAGVWTLTQDAPSAWAFARRHFAGPTRLYVMGHSLGDAVMLQAEPGLDPQPAGVIVADSFASLKDFLARRGTSPLLVGLMPDLWDNVRAMQKVRAPLLMVQSDADTLTPMDGAERVYAAAHSPKHFAVVHGFKHNGSRRRTSETWWDPVLAIVGSPGVSKAPLVQAQAQAAAPAGEDALAAEMARENAIRTAAAGLAPAPSASAAAPTVRP